MFIIVFISCLALFFSFLESKGRFQNGMFYGFILVTIIGAIHFDFGNDYMAYYELYQSIALQPFDLDRILSGEVYRDPGWVILNYAFIPVGGFFMLVAVLNILQNIIVYRFIKDEVDVKWYPFAVFLYLFTSSFYLMSFTMMRQWFVACIFLGMWRFIKKKNLVVSIFVLYLCHFVHSTAIVLLPFAFFGYLPMKRSRVYAVIFAVLMVLLWVSGRWVNELLDSVMSFAEMDEFKDRYNYTEKLAISFGVGAILQIIPLVLGLYFLLNVKFYDVSKKRLVLLSLISFATTPLIAFFPIIGRLGTYFSVFQLATIPIVYGYVRNDTLRKGFIFLQVMITVYTYYLFFLNPVWQPYYSTYHTIFSVL